MTLTNSPSRVTTISPANAKNQQAMSVCLGSDHAKNGSGDAMNQVDKFGNASKVIAWTVYVQYDIFEMGRPLGPANLIGEPLD